MLTTLSLIYLEEDFMSEQTTVTNLKPTAKPARKPKYFAELAVPTLELEVIAKASNGASASILVGFKQYDALESRDMYHQYQEILKPAFDIDKRISGEKDDSGKWVRKPEEVGYAAIQDVRDSVYEKVNLFVREQVVYVRNMQLMEAENVKASLVKDTRKEVNESLWEGYADCLDFLLDILLSSKAWRDSVITAMTAGLHNMDLQKLNEVGN
jgi:hypothetical protein